MTTPRRRPLELDDTWDRDLRNLERDLKRNALSVLLGISSLKADLYDAGWPARSPEDDRGPRIRPEADSTTNTVWQCCECGNQFDSWDDFQTHAEFRKDGHQEAIEVTSGHATTGADHNDPAGDAAMHLWHRHGDLDTLQDHWHAMATSWRAIKLIAGRHKPDGDKRTEPACWHATCESVVEKRHLSSGDVSYRGMECIDGVWVARPGERPVCRMHRARQDREAS